MKKYIKCGKAAKPEILFEYDGNIVYDLIDQVKELEAEGDGDIDEWGVVQFICGDIGLDYNFSIDNTTGEMINQSAFYVMNFDGEYWDTDTSIYKHYEIDFQDPDWEKKVKDFGNKFLTEVMNK